MSSRVGLRALNQAFRPVAFQSRSTVSRAPLRNRQQIARRYQTTDSTAAAPPPHQNIFQKLWTSEVGVKTVHFWAPVMKWALVLAGVGDFFRPPEKLSLTQNAALLCTGTIWTRWCFVIRPKNLFLAAVNACLACVGVVQVSRILIWRQSQAGSTEDAAKELKGEAKDTLKLLEKDTKQAV